MSTDLCSSKLLKGLYGVRPTMKILPTQPMINFSMEEIVMTVSEHSCCSGGGYGTDAKEATYLRTLPQYLEFAQDGPTPVYKDNTACIGWGNNVIGGRERAKQIDIRKHFAHEAIKNGHLILKKDPTMLQLADIMTKDVKQPQWGMCMDGLLGKPLVPSVQTVVVQEGGDD